jgi:hypothetical protein
VDIMAFAKIDTKILSSSIWVDRGIRDVFLTALLMALPYEVTEPLPQIEINSLELTGFVVPPGWYGFVAAAGSGLIRMALLEPEEGEVSLRALGEPDLESRSQEFDGRRMVRVNGGFIILNFMKYRDRDTTNIDRQRRFRIREKERASSRPSPLPPETQLAAQGVMEACMISDVRLRKVIEKSIEDFVKTKGGTPRDAAERMVSGFNDYKEAAQLLRFTVGMHKFFGHGLWCNQKLWPIDQERLVQWQNARVGSF